MKWSTKNFYRKFTPIKIHIAADSIYAGCTAGLGTSIICNYRILGLILIIVMVITKTISEGYAQDDESTKS